MATGKINRKATGKMVSLFPQQLEIINHLIADKGMGSASDVIRQALNYMHDALYPAYVFNLTPAGKLKAMKIKELEIEASITPEQLAEELKAVPVTDPSGARFFRIRGNSNVDRCIPYDSFKEVVKNDGDWLISEHKNFIASGGVVPAEFTNVIWPK
jgi:hypothetical protein